MKHIFWTLMTAFACFVTHESIWFWLKGLDQETVCLALGATLVLVILRHIIRPVFQFTEVFIHEFTHLFFCLLFFRKVTGFKVGRTSGYVKYLGPTRGITAGIITLSPYCIPIVPLLLQVICWSVNFFELYYIPSLWSKALVITSLVAYFQLQKHQFHADQPDFEFIGRYCSICCIISLNLLWLTVLSAF